MEEGEPPAPERFRSEQQPKQLIATLAEDLLATFEKAPLLDPYDIYRHLMDYWAETMLDDCYLIASDGWRQAAEPRLILADKAQDKKNKVKLKPDFVAGKKKYRAELVQPALVSARHFVKNQPIERLW